MNETQDCHPFRFIAFRVAFFMLALFLRIMYTLYMSKITPLDLTRYNGLDLQTQLKLAFEDIQTKINEIIIEVNK